MTTPNNSAIWVREDIVCALSNNNVGRHVTTPIIPTPRASRDRCCACAAAAYSCRISAMNGHTPCIRCARRSSRRTHHFIFLVHEGLRAVRRPRQVRRHAWGKLLRVEENSRACRGPCGGGRSAAKGGHAPSLSSNEHHFFRGRTRDVPMPSSASVR